MFVVKRPFKSLGKVYTAGSVISEPAEIKRFNGRFAEGKIVEVTQANYNAMSDYFKCKFGVELPELSGKANDEPKDAVQETADKDAVQETADKDAVQEAAEKDTDKSNGTVKKATSVKASAKALVAKAAVK